MLIYFIDLYMRKILKVLALFYFHHSGDITALG